MIVGIGTDIIETARIERALKRGRFVKRLYTDIEMDYLKNKNAESFAGYFAAKEAVVKALGTGFSGFQFKDIEVYKERGAPLVRLYGNALIISQNKGIKSIHLSISHCKEYATAVAVAEG